MTALTDALLVHAAAVTGLSVERLRANAPLDLSDVRAHLDRAEATTDLEGAAFEMDAAIQALVSHRHNLMPGPVRRYLPDLRPGLVLMEAASDRWDDDEWRRSRRDPAYFVNQHGVPCDPRALPASLVVVPTSAERAS